MTRPLIGHRTIRLNLEDSTIDWSLFSRVSVTLEATSNETTELEWFRAEKYTRRISADIREITKTLPPIHAANLKNFQLRGDAHRFPVSREEEKRRRRRRRGNAVKRDAKSWEGVTWEHLDVPHLGFASCPSGRREHTVPVVFSAADPE